jgi:UDP-N-acetyl-2-amino-2-deoxyglucuronate dehydrogenase
MSTIELRIGILGCGVIAPAHIDSYRLIDSVQVVAVCDVNQQRIDQLKERYPDLLFATYTDYRALLADPAIDAVSVCTDHASHEAIVLAALAAGKHLICEKPLTTTVDSVQRMVRAANASPLVVAGVFQHRFDPVFRALRAAIDGQHFGRPLLLTVRHRCLRTADYYTSDAWRGTWAGEGGSLLINQSIHYVDIAQWLMGGVRSVQAQIANLGHSGVIETEDTATLAIEYANGALGTLVATTASHHGWQSIVELTGTDGSVAIVDGAVAECSHRDPQVAEAVRARLTEIPAVDGVAGAKIYYGTSHPAQLADFVAAIRERRPPFVSLADAAPAVNLVLAAYASARSGMRVTL